MKFAQLPVGARFEFDGQVYTKNSPIAASPDDGGAQRMIPRFAMLAPVGDEAPPAAPRKSRQVDEDRVLQAFEAHHAVCLRLLQQAATMDEDELRMRLAGARQQFLDTLSL